MSAKPPPILTGAERVTAGLVAAAPEFRVSVEPHCPATRAASIAVAAAASISLVIVFFRVGPASHATAVPASLAPATAGA